jgi:hypothetical protein
MTIRVELDRKTEARLIELAQNLGVTPEKYAGELIKDALGISSGETGRMTSEEVHEMLREIAAGSENVPSLPASALTRESFYEDRD